MTACTRSAVAMFTDFFASDDIEAAARRTGFVKRTSKITGKLFLALITFGVWSEAKTTLAQLAAKVTQVEGHVDVSPEALHQRMNKRAIAFLQAMIQQALGNMQALASVCEDHLFEHFLKVHIVDSTGFSLPENLQDSFPGSGGSATKAGAKMQLVWEYKQSLLEHFALMPWKLPDNTYVDTVVAFARQGSLFLFDLGYFKIKALARMAAAGAYFLTRLNHQANLFVEVNGHLAPFDVASFLKTMEGHLIEKQISLGAIDLVAARLIASRVPDQVVNERRRAAKKRAKKKGYTPSNTHLEL
jgi:Transposase DDE domain